MCWIFSTQLYLYGDFGYYCQAWGGWSLDQQLSPALPGPRQWSVPWPAGPVVSCGGAATLNPWAQLYSAPLRWWLEPGSSETPSFNWVLNPVTWAAPVSELSPYLKHPSHQQTSNSPYLQLTRTCSKNIFTQPQPAPLQSREANTCQTYVVCLD